MRGSSPRKVKGGERTPLFRHPGEGRGPASGIGHADSRIPAFAGMTAFRWSRLRDYANRTLRPGRGQIHRPILRPSFAAANITPTTHSTSHSDHIAAVRA